MVFDYFPKKIFHLYSFIFFFFFFLLLIFIIVIIVTVIVFFIITCLNAMESCFIS